MGEWVLRWWVEVGVGVGRGVTPLGVGMMGTPERGALLGGKGEVGRAVEEGGEVENAEAGMASSTMVDMTRSGVGREADAKVKSSAGREGEGKAEE